MGAKRILVVDDETLVLDAVRLTLTYYGYTVETATSGPEALLRMASAPFDLVVTDRKMPGMPGDQLAAQVKRQWPACPIILLTGFPPEVKPDGIDVILLKPFSMAELQKAIHGLLSRALTSLAGKTIEFTTCEKGSERLTFKLNGSVTSDRVDTPGTYTYTTGAGGKPSTLVVTFPTGAVYHLTMDFSDSAHGSWSGSRHLDNADHPVPFGSSFAVQNS
jgi:DNA-binding response OmpR family regulator